MKTNPNMLRTGICGIGDYNHYFHNFLKPSDDMEITGCYDPDYDRALAFARQHKIIAYRSPEKLLPYTDALLVTSTRPEAVSWCEMAIRNCHHVFLHEDHSIPNDTLLRFRSLAREANVLLFIPGKFTSLPAVESVCTWANRPYLLDMKCQMPIRDNLLMHLFLLALTLQEGSFRKIESKKWTGNPEIPPTCCARIEFDNGAMMNLTIEDSPKLLQAEIRVLSSKASIHADLLTGHLSTRYTGYSDIISEHNLPGTDAERLARELSLFLRAIRNESDAVRIADRQQASIDLVARWHQSIRSYQIA